MKQLFLLFVFMMSLSACSRDTHNHPSNITNKELFEDHCVACHAPGGTGSILLGAPSNKDTKMLNIQIRKKIREGSGGDSTMPVFHNMSVKEASRIISYLRSLPQDDYQ